MSDLIPDSWRQDEGESQCCSQPRRSNRKGPVTDILLWLECYSSLVAVLASRYPSKVGHFMAYQKTIIKAQRSFIGEGWVIYDTCFRRKAANVKSLDWGEVDLTLTMKLSWEGQKLCRMPQQTLPRRVLAGLLKLLISPSDKQ